MDDPKLIKTLSRRQIGRLERFGESRVPARRAVAATSALTASLPNVDWRPQRPPLVELSYPAATQGRSWIMLN